VANGARGRGPSAPGSVRIHGTRKERRESGSRRQSHEPEEVRSRTLERALRGNGSLRDGRYLRSIIGLRRSRTRVDADLGDFKSCLHRASGRTREEGATGIPEVRPPRVARGDEKLLPRRSTKHVGPTEARRSDVNQAIPRSAGRASATTLTGTNEARVLVRRREKAEVDPTHRAFVMPEMPQGHSATRR